MTEGFVDSASLYEVILALARSKPKHTYKMEWDRALVVTTAFINAKHIKLAPSPTAELGASGAYGIILESLTDAVSRITLTHEDHAKAMSRTKDWARRNADKLRETVAKFDQPSDRSSLSPFQRWVDAHILNEWSEHSRRHRGLFDAEFIPQLCKVFQISEPDLRQILERTGQASFVENLVRRRPDSDEFRLVRDAFIASTLLRGKYHECAANVADGQIVTHPIRKSIQNLSSASTPRVIDVSNTERCLSNLVMASAFSQRNHEPRAAQWANDVATLRKVRQQINLDPKERDEVALQVAIDAAKRFGIIPNYRLVETVVDVGIGLGSCALGHFVLTPFQAVIMDVAIVAASAKRKIGTSLVSPFAGRRGKLRKLAQFEPGRIDEGESSP